MIGHEQFVLFLLASWALILTPGPDTIYVLTRGVAGGRGAGIMSALGCSTGLLAHTVMAGLGLSLVLATSATAFMLVKLAGAAYLIYLGLSALFRGKGALPLPGGGKAGPLAVYRQGFFTNLLNPKVALFFLAFLPQFVNAAPAAAGWPVLLLGLTFTACALCYKLVLALFAGSLGEFITGRPAILKRVRQASGAVMVALGLKLALSGRD